MKVQLRHQIAYCGDIHFIGFIKRRQIFREIAGFLGECVLIRFTELINFRDIGFFRYQNKPRILTVIHH